MTKALIVIQARMRSSRFPNKAMAMLSGRTVLSWVITRLLPLPYKLVVATGKSTINNPIIKQAEQLGVATIRGDEEDVMSRFALATREYPLATTVVRVTGDNPLTDPALVQAVIDSVENKNADYAFVKMAPYGSGADAFKVRVLDQLAKVTRDKRHREHINTFILDNHLRFDIRGIDLPPPLRRSDVRVTLDTKQDLERLAKIFEYLNDPTTAGIKEIIAAYDRLPKSAMSPPFLPELVQL